MHVVSERSHPYLYSRETSQWKGRINTLLVFVEEWLDNHKSHTQAHKDQRYRKCLFMLCADLFCVLQASCRATDR